MCFYNMDDISEIANENLKSRMAEVEKQGALANTVKLWDQIRQKARVLLKAIYQQI